MSCFWCCSPKDLTSVSMSLASVDLFLTCPNGCKVQTSWKKVQEFILYVSTQQRSSHRASFSSCQSSDALIKWSNTWSTASFDPKSSQLHIPRVGKTLEKIQIPGAGSWMSLHSMKGKPLLVFPQSSTSLFCPSAEWLHQGSCLKTESLLQSQCWTWP